MYSYNIYTRIWIKDYIYIKITSICAFIKILCYIKISCRSLYHYLPLKTKTIWSDMVLLIISSRIFSFWNLMTHGLCRHYFSMTNVNFIQETDQMNKYESRSRFSYYLSIQILVMPNGFYIVMCLSFMHYKKNVF